MHFDCDFLIFMIPPYDNLLFDKNYMISISCLQLISRVYKDEIELESYLRSDFYDTCNQVK